MIVIGLCPLAVPVSSAVRDTDSIQFSRHRYIGRAGDEFGAAVAIVGDLNGDGFPDIAVGAVGTDPGGAPVAGSVWAIDGVSGDLLFRHTSDEPGAHFGFRIAAAGDVNGDGLGDVIVGVPFSAPGGRYFAGSIFVLAGPSGDTLYRIDGDNRIDYFGNSVATAGDLTGDGCSEFLVGAPFTDPNGRINAGSVFLYDGASGTLLSRWDGMSAYDNLGWTVIGDDDLNGDGYGEIVAGAIGAGTDTASGPGAVFVFDGRTREFIDSITGRGHGDQFGFALSVTDDVTGDSVPDIVVGAPFVDSDEIINVGSVYVIDGVTGEEIQAFVGTESDAGFGRAVAAVGDIDGDGNPDIAIGAPFASPGNLSVAGSVFIVDAVSGSLLVRIDGAEGDLYGVSLSGGYDLRGDENDDLLIGAPFADPQGLSFAGVADVIFLCDCSCHGDLNCDGRIGVRDLVLLVSAALRSKTELLDDSCPYANTDVDCDGETNVVDVVRFIDVVFRGRGDESFCDPCD